MTSEPSPPRIDVCAGLYLDIWTLFGEQPFESEDLARRLIELERDIGPITGPNKPERHLDLLVAYGPLERDDDGRYRVRCSPEESVKEWQRDLRPQLEAVYKRIHQLKQRRTDDHHDEKGAQNTALVRREGKTYAGTDLDEDATFPEVVAELTDSMGQYPEADGVALRSPAALAGEVQQLADRLCSAEAMTDVDCPRFEKENSDVVGEHKDDLEYRLYLRPAR